MLILFNVPSFGQTRTDNIKIDIGLDWIDIPAKHTYDYKVSDDGSRIYHGAWEISGRESLSANGVSFRSELNAKGSNINGQLNGPISVVSSIYGNTGRQRMNAKATITGSFKNGLPNGTWNFSLAADGNIIDFDFDTENCYATYKDGMLVGAYKCGREGSFDASGRLNGIWTYDDAQYQFIKGIMVSESSGESDTPPAEKALATNYANGKISAEVLFSKGYCLKEFQWDLGMSIWELLSEELIGFWKKGGGYDFRQATEPTKFLYLAHVEMIGESDFQKLLQETRRDGEAKMLCYDSLAKAQYVELNEERYYLSADQQKRISEQEEGYKRDHAYTSLIDFYNAQRDGDIKGLSLDIAKQVLSSDYPADKAAVWYKTALKNVEILDEYADPASYYPTEDKLYYREVLVWYENGEPGYSDYYIKASAFDDYKVLSKMIHDFNPEQIEIWKQEQEQAAREEIVKMIRNKTLYNRISYVKVKNQAQHNSNFVKQSFEEAFGAIYDCSIESVSPYNESQDIVVCIIYSRGEYYLKKYRAQFTFYKDGPKSCKILVDPNDFKKNRSYLLGEKELNILQRKIAENKAEVESCGMDDVIQPFGQYINGVDTAISSDYLATEKRLLQILDTEKACLAFIKNRKLIVSQDQKIRETCSYKSLLKAYTSYMDKDEGLKEELAWNIGKTDKNLTPIIDMQRGILDGLDKGKGEEYEQRVKAFKKTSIREMFTKGRDGKYAIDSMLTPKELKAAK